LPRGCAFSNRCPKAHDACQVRPEFVVDAQGHGAACVLVGEKK